MEIQLGKMKDPNSLVAGTGEREDAVINSTTMKIFMERVLHPIAHQQFLLFPPL